MPNAAYSRVEINEHLDVAPHTGPLEGKRLLVELDPGVCELNHKQDESGDVVETEVTGAAASLTRDEVEHLRDCCNDWLEAA